MKKIILIIILFLSIFSQLFALRIYRPENDGEMNTIRCYIRILDEDDNDVTYTCGKAFYSWFTKPRVFYFYRKNYYLSGGMVMHINLKPGKYKISVYTPVDKQNGFECENKDQWESNTLFYNTENPTNVIFISPTANENIFYNGGWHIDYYAPKFYIYTKPYITE